MKRIVNFVDSVPILNMFSTFSSALLYYYTIYFIETFNNGFNITSFYKVFIYRYQANTTLRCYCHVSISALWSVVQRCNSLFQWTATMPPIVIDVIVTELLTTPPRMEPISLACLWFKLLLLVKKIMNQTAQSLNTCVNEVSYVS